MNLFHLHCAIDEKANVVEDQTNDLNGILHAKRIQDEYELIYKSKDIKRKEGRYCMTWSTTQGITSQIELEGSKYIAMN